MASDFSITVEVPNLLKTQKQLEELGVVKVPQAMRKVVVAGAKPIKAAILAETPVGFPSVNSRSFSGDLKRSVKYKSGKTTSALAAIAGVTSRVSYYMIGPMGKGSAHRHLVILGHEVVGHAPNFTKTGRRTTPNPFVGRGREASQGAAIAATEVAAAAALEEATRL